MTISRAKKPPKPKRLPKPARTDGPCCTGCGKATTWEKAKFVMRPLFPDAFPTEYACSKKCYDIWAAREPGRGSKTAKKWA